MRFVSAGEIDRLLSFPRLIEALASAFRADPRLPPRHHHALPQPEGADATLLLMPAWTDPGGPGGFVGVKVVTVFPDNRARGLPSVQGTYLLLDGETGAALAALDGTRLTLWRTAAASALAAGYLARPDATRLLMVGSGALAPFLIRAHGGVRPLQRIALWNHRPDRAASLAAELAREGLPVEAVTDLEAEVRAADIVSCATLSAAPLIRGAWLRAGQHLDLVGAFSLAMREVDDDALRRAALFIDTPAALHEGGDVAVAIREGVLTPDDVRGHLAELAAGRVAGRRNADEITLFKSIGASLEDLVAATEVWRRLTIS